jgi:hypothetical protein
VGCFLREYDPQVIREIRTVNTWNGRDGELTLAGVQHEFPQWVCWRGDCGQLYARRQQTPDGEHDATGGDPLDLRDAIILALRLEQADTRPATPADSAHAGARAPAG